MLVFVPAVNIMKTRDLMATMWVGLVIVAVTLGLVTAGVFLDNRDLRREGRDLRVELDARSTEATDLKTERSLIEQELRAQRERVEAMSVQLAELKLGAAAKEPAVPQQAYRIRAFLDNQWVSQGWLVPGRATTNASGQLVYEPVVVLDPSARTALTAVREPAPAPAPPILDYGEPQLPDDIGYGLAGVLDCRRRETITDPTRPWNHRRFPDPAQATTATGQSFLEHAHLAAADGLAADAAGTPGWGMDLDVASGTLPIYRAERVEAFRVEAAPVPSPPAIERVAAYLWVAGGVDRGW